MTSVRLTRPLRLAAAAAVLVLGAGALTACSSGSGSGSSSALRLGYFPNVTHAAALVGVKEGFFQKQLDATSTKLTTQTFNAGSAAVEALNAGAIDATYVGANPAVNAFVASSGDAIRIISGATSGGAAFVVQPTINSAADLKGKTVASPQLGNTQDVALRYWLDQQGLKTSVTGSGDVDIQSADNSVILQQFQDKKIAGAWVPEPWASRLVLEGGGKVLVDEATLWPKGRFVTTQLIVRTAYLQAHPDQITALLKGQVESTAWIRQNPAKAKADVNASLQALTGKTLTPQTLDRAWAAITVTNDPIATSLITAAKHGVAVGVTKSADLHGIYDLAPLNAVLQAQGEATVSDAGYGTKP